MSADLFFLLNFFFAAFKNFSNAPGSCLGGSGSLSAKRAASELQDTWVAKVDDVKSCIPLLKVVSEILVLCVEFALALVILDVVVGV